MSALEHSGKMSFRPLKGSLAKKLILAIVITSSSLAFVITGVQLYVDFRNDLENVSKKLSDIERGYSNSITESVWVLNDEQVARQLKGLVAIPGIYSAVIKVDGDVRWQENILTEGDAYPKHYQQHKIALIKRYKQQDRLVGELILSESLDGIYLHLYDKAILIFLTNMLKTFLVSTFLFFFFYFFITRHLYKLSEYAKDIKLGTYIEPLQFDRTKKPESKKDELDHLSDAINIMRENLIESYVSISQVNDKLKKELVINEKINAELAGSKELIVKKESELDSIINNLFEGVIVLREDFSILRMNSAARKTFKYNDSEDDLGDIKLNDLVPEIDLDTLSITDSPDALIIANSQNAYYGVDAEDNKFPLRLSLVALPTGDSKKYICTCQDITKERQKDEQLQRSRKMDALGNLTGGIAHDYNNMLGVVIGYAELLELEIGEQAKPARYVEAIIHASKRGAKLTKKLLAFSRNTSSDTDIVHINKLLQDEQHILEKTLTARIKLVLDLDSELWLVNIDSSDLEDAILNMGINAMHAMTSGGQLTICTCNTRLVEADTKANSLRPGDYVVITITDTGTGMDDTTRQRVFDPFFTTKGQRGTGLGLSQVYGFMQRSEGMIQVYSEPGHGTRFSLYFPRAYQIADEEEKPVNIPDINLHGTETVLVVDDETAITSLIEVVLVDHGYKVFIAHNGLQALDILKHENANIDIIISDIIMPEMDGCQLAKEVQPLYPHIKIQMVSGFADDRHHGVINDALHKNMMYKPCSSQALLIRIRHLLDNAVVDNKLTSQTILIIHDDYDELERFQFHLEMLGYNTVTARSGEEALELYQLSLQREDRIAAIIIDLASSVGIGGKQLASKILELDVDARIIASSGHPGSVEMANYRDYGFSGAIEKSFNTGEIKQIVEHVLSARATE